LEKSGERKADDDARARCRNAEAIPVKDRIRQPITKYHEMHRT
jgi:hypothetical protein